jgi:diguanylate cyclase (GGDEF)-like protein
VSAHPDRGLRARGHLHDAARGLSPPADRSDTTLVDSYRRLADVFHLILAEQDVALLLERIADALEDLVPHDTLSIYEADEARRLLRPVLVRDQWAEEIMSSPTAFGEGLTGWAVENREPVLANQAHLDPRVAIVPGTPDDEAEALVSIPLIARGSIKGALNIYRLGEAARFDDVEFELARRFGDAAALALDNAEIRARLEHQAQTDALTGCFNHRLYHERLRAELERASRSGESVAVLMLDLDDFKHVNDVHGHAAGDEVLVRVADALRSVVRAGDVVCRLGGEEFAVIVTPAGGHAATTIAARLVEVLTGLDFGPPGRVTVSIGLAEGPEHAMNPRELTACAEAAMMTAKAQGKDRVVRFAEDELTRPEAQRSLRTLAHMKLLQSLSARLNRLNDLPRVGEVIAEELHGLIDYHNCRVFVVEGEDVVPIAFRGDLAASGPTHLEALRVQVGEGITGHVAATGRTLLLRDAAASALALKVPGTHRIEESVIAAPLLYGARVTGVILISKLGLDQLDEDDARLVELLSGHAAIALENAQLYEAQRREAESATVLLEFGRALAGARTLDEALGRIVQRSAHALGSARTSVWVQDAATGELVGRAEHGHDADGRGLVSTSRFPAAMAERLLAGDTPFVLGPEVLLGIDGLSPADATFAIAPFDLEDGRRGCILASIDKGPEAPERELRLLAGLAYQARLAISTAEGFHGLEQTFRATLEALADTLGGRRGVPGAAAARAVADTA